MTIRSILPADIPTCATLFSAVFSNPPWNENWTLENAHRRLADCVATPNFLGVLAEDNYAVTGFAMGYLQHYMDERHYFLLELCVDTHRQRGGIGGALMSALNTRLKEAAGFYVSPKMILMARRFTS